ncbi:TPA: hypothetical protein DF272_04245 [Candidatus Falkowbacteria bacterium]|nr:hypothetical protein [Candidatus Falkowbacteria bacterium]
MTVAKRHTKTNTKSAKKKTAVSKAKSHRQIRKSLPLPETTSRVASTANFDLSLFIPTEPIKFDLTEEEIAELLNLKNQQDETETNQQLYAELLRLLPQHEPVVSSHDPKTKNIVVQNIRSRHETSPFVINLEKLIADKEAKAKRLELAQKHIRSWQTPQQTVVNHNSNTDSHPAKITPKLKFSFKRNHQVEVEISAPLNQLKTSHTENPNDQFTPHSRYIYYRLWIKPIVIFTALAALAILPIKGFTYYKQLNDQKDSIISTAESALANLQTAGQNVAGQDTTAAKGNFAAAKIDFEQAGRELDNINSYVDAVLKIIPTTGQYLTDAKRLTQAGIISSDLGAKVTDLFTAFYLQENTAPLTEKISTLNQSLTADIIPAVDALNQNLEPIDTDILPKDKQAVFLEKRQQLKLLGQDLKNLSTLSTTINDILGQDYKRRYLFVFQNNSEIRASGGFLGSLALVDIHHGAITNIEIPGGGSYDFQGSLLKSVESPTPLHLINPKWELQDSNWFFDFPTSAKKIQWFFENAGGPSVDGVIAINATVLSDLLTTTNPIYLPEYGKTITAENVIIETQKSVEIEYDKKENKPKQFIADLAPKLLEQLFDGRQTNLVGLVKVLKTGLQTKDIQVYFNNNLHQEQFASQGWTGEMKDTSQDYLAVINTNIAGGKTDLYINQTIDHESTIHDDGTITDTLTITRTHTGDLSDIFSGVRNVNYLRLYVPEGSVLLSADGFTPPDSGLFKLPEDHYTADSLLTARETAKKIDPVSNTVVYEENTKTVFANWTQTDPGQTSTIKITYQLPFKLTAKPQSLINKLFNANKPETHYSVLYQKQSGSRNTILNSRITLPASIQPLWSYPEESLEPVLDKTIDLSRDTFNAVIFTVNQ